MIRKLLEWWAERRFAWATSYLGHVLGDKILVKTDPDNEYVVGIAFGTCVDVIEDIGETE